jgi:pyruvyltransferase
LPEVEIFSWNPPWPVLRVWVGWRVPWRRPINNFGDLLGPLIVRGIMKQRGLGPEALRPARLLSVGSIMHFAQDGDVIWGSGVHGDIAEEQVTARDLDIRAVRGPRTRAFLLERGITAPEVYGDPALLLPVVMPELREQAQRKRFGVTVVPNYLDLDQNPAWRLSPKVLNPRAPLARVLSRIAASELVVGSSLHGIAVAESLGVPARLVRSAVEIDFKYRDYYEGTGRPGYSPAETIREAIAAGGELPPVFSPQALLAAFPADLWQPSSAVDQLPAESALT